MTEPNERVRFTATADMTVEWIVFPIAGKVHVNPPVDVKEGTTYEAELHTVNGQAEVVINPAPKSPGEVRGGYQGSGSTPPPRPEGPGAVSMSDDMIRTGLRGEEQRIRDTVRDELGSIAGHMLSTYGTAKEAQRTRAESEEHLQKIDENNHAAIATWAGMLLQELAERHRNDQRVKGATTGDATTHAPTTSRTEEP